LTGRPHDELLIDISILKEAKAEYTKLEQTRRYRETKK
jgi:hypothetical protein